jgi:hypothetical protein
VFVPPRQLALLREIVESAITAFAEAVAKGSAKRVYGETLGTKAGESK